MSPGSGFRILIDARSARAMRECKERFLNLRNFPARLTGEQAAWLLGFEEHDISKLVLRKFLKPLGNPPQNCVKMFWLKDVQELAENREKLAKASDAIRRGGRPQAATRLDVGAADYAEAA
jgi:hypothetical protein